MSLNIDDIRAAVSAGVLTEAQAIKLTALSQSRQGLRNQMGAQDEPFELFKGFNEIFIVVGLVILFTGWLGFSGINIALSGDYSSGSVIYSGITVAVIALFARYFTNVRRMMGPSNALVVMFFISAIFFAISATRDIINLVTMSGVPLTAGLLSFLMLGYWLLFRVPFTLMFVAISTYATAFLATLSTGAELGDTSELFLLGAQGPFALLTLGLGLLGLIAAMYFDMRDPHRVTLSAQNGFWLHIIAAPAIVNTVAMTLYQAGGTVQTIGLLIFLALMALFAVVIDRRSFLMAGIGYIVALVVTVMESDSFGGGFMMIMILGGGLVLLGSQWESLRGFLMSALPDFPGKNRLPPYAKGL